MLLTLSEMAAQLKCSVRTFSKDVKEKRIPHKVVGRSKRFNPDVVEAHLDAIESPSKPQRGRSVRFARVSKYDKLLEA